MGSRSRPGGGWLRGGAALLLALLGGGALATAVGAARYPGGSWVDPRSPGHSVWGNFLCDIARDLAVNGQPEPGSAMGSRGRVGLRARALPLLVARARAPRATPVASRHPRARDALRARAPRVPVTVDVGHLLALVAGAGPGFAAGGLVVRGLQARPWLALLGAVALLLAALELGSTSPSGTARPRSRCRRCSGSPCSPRSPGWAPARWRSSGVRRTARQVPRPPARPGRRRPPPRGRPPR